MRTERDTVVISISYAVMAHPARLEHAKALHALIRGQGGKICPYIALADELRPGDVWGTAREAWQQHDQHESAWHVVVQDDAILADDFHEAAQTILSAASETRTGAVSFFSFADSARKLAMGATFLELTGITLYAVALAIPHARVQDMLDWTAEHEARGERLLGWGAAPNTRHDDKRILDWARARGLPCYVAAPNVVDHDPGPSIANPKSRIRVSQNFLRIGARHLDWQSAPVVKTRR